MLSQPWEELGTTEVLSLQSVCRSSLLVRFTFSGRLEGMKPAIGGRSQSAGSLCQSSRERHSSPHFSQSQPQAALQKEPVSVSGRCLLALPRPSWSHPGPCLVPGSVRRGAERQPQAHRNYKHRERSQGSTGAVKGPEIPPVLQVQTDRSWARRRSWKTCKVQMRPGAEPAPPGSTGRAAPTLQPRPLCFSSGCGSVETQLLLWFCCKHRACRCATP